MKIFTSTGRHLLELQELGVTELAFDGHVLLNGQICLDKEEQLIDACAIPEEDMQGALRWFEEMELPVAFVEQKQIYINFINRSGAEDPGGYFLRTAKTRPLRWRSRSIWSMYCQ